MAVGDIKGPEAVVMELTAGEAITKGDLVHLETDGKFDIGADTDTGKFAVAIEAASGDAVTFRAVVWGRVEVTSENTTVKAEVMMAGATGQVTPTDHGAIGENCGTSMEACASAGTTTLWVGLVG